jgi:hypothetical protein
MSLRSLILFTLAGSARSWPQVPEFAHEAGSAASLLSTENVPASRSLPSFEDDGLAQTLHIPTAEPLGGIAKRKPYNGRGALSLPVVQMPKPALSRLGIEVQLENRSDVAYYAQRKIHLPTTVEVALLTKN